MGAVESTWGRERGGGPLLLVLRPLTEVVGDDGGRRLAEIQGGVVAPLGRASAGVEGESEGGLG